MSNTFYIDPILEASRYGIDVKASSSLGDGIDGMIEKNDNGIIIYVNSQDSLNRQRFTIAHELGHYVCGHLQNGKTKFRDGKKEYSQNNFDTCEYEANTYAAELLMPSHKIDFLIYQEEITTIDALAKSLIVSNKAMEIRLQKLGLIT